MVGLFVVSVISSLPTVGADEGQSFLGQQRQMRRGKRECVVFGIQARINNITNPSNIKKFIISRNNALRYCQFSVFTF